MKKVVIAALLCASAVLFAQNAKPEFRACKLVNADFAAPSESGMIGWSFPNRDFSGRTEVVTENGVKTLKIIPEWSAYCKKTKVLRGICQNSGEIRAKVGDTVKYEVTFKGEPGARIGFIISNGAVNQWVTGQTVCNGTWQTVTREYVIKATANARMDAAKKYYFAADVFHKPVTLKTVKVSLKKVKAAK